MPEPSITYLQSYELAAQGKRNFDTLNKFAEAFINQGATSIETAISVRMAARLVGMDPGNAARAIKDKPGFVPVRRLTAAGSVAVGVYYSFEFMICANSQGSSYPVNLSPLFETRIPKLVILPPEMREESPLRTVAKPEPRMVRLLGADADKAEQVVVPAIVNGNTDHRVVVTYLSAIAEKFTADGDYEALLEYPAAKLPDDDLATMVDVFAKLSINFTSIYKTLATQQEGRELK